MTEIVLIQAALNGWALRSALKLMIKRIHESNVTLKEEDYSATIIQAAMFAWSLRRSIRFFSRRIRASDDALSQEDESATKIQAALLGFGTRISITLFKRCIRYHHFKRIKEKEIRAALKIQSSIEGYRVRKLMAKQIGAVDNFYMVANLDPVASEWVVVAMDAGDAF